MGRDHKYSKGLMRGTIKAVSPNGATVTVKFGTKAIIDASVEKKLRGNLTIGMHVNVKSRARSHRVMSIA